MNFARVVLASIIAVLAFGAGGFSPIQGRPAIESPAIDPLVALKP